MPDIRPSCIELRNLNFFGPKKILKNSRHKTLMHAERKFHSDEIKISRSKNLPQHKNTRSEKTPSENSFRKKHYTARENPASERVFGTVHPFFIDTNFMG